MPPPPRLKTERQLDLPHVGALGAPAEGPWDPTIAPVLARGLDGPPKCCREVPAREWIHELWLRDAELIAVICLRINPGCKKCRAMLLMKYRRSI